MKIIDEERLAWAAAEISKLCMEAEAEKREAELAVLVKIAEGFAGIVAGTTLTRKIRVGTSAETIQISIHKKHALREEAVKPYILMIAKHFQEAANAEECVFAEELDEILEALRDALGCFEIAWEEMENPAGGFSQEMYIDFEEDVVYRFREEGAE